MKRLTLLLGFLLFFSLVSIADSWTDPEWEEMLDSSDVIAMVKFTSSGKFKARAKVLTTYYGKASGNEIWISGFSNRYGPIDKVNSGDKFIVFLRRSEVTEGRTEYWEKQLKEDPKLKAYVEAYKQGRVFYVWSPTSGDLRVRKSGVQYDLMQTSFYSKQNYWPLKEFETFLKERQKPDASGFHRSIMNKLKQSPLGKQSPQYLMMLSLSSYSSFDPIFKTIAESQKPDHCYALAKLLGNVEGDEARNLLVQLLDHENSIVQGEVVRQLSDQDADFLGPILLKRLNSAGEEGVYPSNIMDPVMNSLDGGKMEIIKTLGKIGYKPAAPALLPLLDTDNEYLFGTTIKVLQQLESRDYIPYLNKILESGNRHLVYKISRIISDQELEECLPSLMKYISTHDKSEHPSQEYLISSYAGLGYFDTDTVRSFLFQDFLTVLKMERGIIIDNKMDWLEEYMDVFTDLKICQAKPYAYEAMFEYFALNSEFNKRPELFERKATVEDSLVAAVKAILVDEKVSEVEALAFIQPTEKDPETLGFLVSVSFGNKDKMETVSSLLEENGFTREQLILRAENHVQTEGIWELPGFGDLWNSRMIQYIGSCPDQEDLAFLENLKKHGYTSSDYDNERLDELIEEVKKILGQ